MSVSLILVFVGIVLAIVGVFVTTPRYPTALFKLGVVLVLLGFALRVYAGW